MSISLGMGSEGGGRVDGWKEVILVSSFWFISPLYSSLSLCLYRYIPADLEKIFKLIHMSMFWCLSVSCTYYVSVFWLPCLVWAATGADYSLLSLLFDYTYRTGNILGSGLANRAWRRRINENRFKAIDRCSHFKL